MKSNKGFTLIELLAVIVILAIIALIATPVILNVVETARKSAAESSILGYIDAVEKQAMINELDADKTNDITKGTYTIEQLDTKGVKVRGDKPSSASVVIDSTGAVANTSTFVTADSRYDVTYNSTDKKWVAVTHSASNNG